MDPQIFEQNIAHLNQAVDGWRWWLDFWTATVVIGLVVEYKDDVKAAFKRPIDWKKVTHLIGALMVTGGVAGEFWVGFKSSEDENALRLNQDKLVHAVRDAATNATRDIALAKKETAIANGKAAEAQKAAACANAQAEAAKAQAAAARKATEDERLERVKLETAVAPRRLTGKQQDILIQNLKGMPPAIVLVVAHMMDDETSDLAEDIVAVLKRGNVASAFNGSNLSHDHGIALGSTTLKRPGGFGQLSQALSKVGLVHRIILVKPSGQLNVQIDDKIIYLFVDRK